MSAALTRRAFVGVLPVALAGLARAARAQEGEPEIPGASMGGDGYIPVRRDPKPGATPQMTPDERDALERKLSCPCPCTLDIFTCRTSMPCGFSPNMHADVVRLVEGGYSGDEIMALFRQAYGEKVLMAPEAKGFNLFGYLAPFIAIGGGGVLLAALLRGWRRDARPAPVAAGPVADATPEELARLEAAVRAEEDRP